MLNKIFNSCKNNRHIFTTPINIYNWDIMNNIPIVCDHQVFYNLESKHKYS